MAKRRRARSPEALREKAEALLRAEGIDEPPVPVEAIAKSLGARVRYAPFKGELAGMLIRDEDGAGPVIGVNSLHHSNRQRFTIAHECGHLRLHEGRPAYFDTAFRINRRDEVSSQATDAEEIEANRFAAELLSPYDMIREDLVEHQSDMEDEEALRKLANRYGISLQALTLRIRSVVEDPFF